jgi:hypothetical protein
LVDFENIRFGFRGTGVPERLHESIATALLTIASRFGNLEIAKVYVSSRRSNAAPAAAEAFRELGFELVFDDPRELDGRMVADGISLLSTRADIGMYILASGDSDFASLARRIVDEEKTLIVLAPTVTACKRLTSYAHTFVPLEQFLSKERIQALRPPVRRPLLHKPADTTTRQVGRVFLCHSKVYKPRVRDLYARLKTEDFVQPWLDEKDLLPGRSGNV